MNDKQKQLLLLFAQNMTLADMGKRFSVSHATISRQLLEIKSLYPEYYANALSMRVAAMRYCKGLSQPSLIDDLDNLADRDMIDKF